MYAENLFFNLDIYYIFIPFKSRSTDIANLFSLQFEDALAEVEKLKRERRDLELRCARLQTAMRATEAELLRFHTAGYIEHIRTMSADRGGEAGESDPWR